MDDLTQKLVVATCALVGAVLGIVNFYRAYLSDAERLRIKVWQGGSERYPGVEVINASAFDVWVTGVRNAYPQEGRAADVVFSQGRLDDANSLPHKIESRNSHTFYVDIRETISQQVRRPAYTFVRTALGGVFTSETRRARWWRRALEAIRIKKSMTAPAG